LEQHNEEFVEDANIDNSLSNQLDDEFIKNEEIEEN
jgi:hypothetical protein